MTPNIRPSSIAKTIDHAVLHPAATEADILDGCRLAVALDVAAFCVASSAVPLVRTALNGSDVALCAVVGFPHGNTDTEMKRAETISAIDNGAEEIDMVVNIGGVKGAQWDRVATEIRAINDAVVQRGASLKVIFETGFLTDDEVVRLCGISGEIGVDYVKTSTGFGYVKTGEGILSATGATIHHISLMRRNVPMTTGIKASGGIRTLNDLLAMMEAGATRIGTSSTQAILDEAKRRGL